MFITFQQETYICHKNNFSGINCGESIPGLSVIYIFHPVMLFLWSLLLIGILNSSSLPNEKVENGNCAFHPEFFLLFLRNFALF